jgi:predicted Zn finger-like uncharacterized protein
VSLVTCCPKCSSEFDVTADQLKLHDGLVRCGHCSHVFDGFACLKDSLLTLTKRLEPSPTHLDNVAPAQPSTESFDAPAAVASQSQTAAPSSPVAQVNIGVGVRSSTPVTQQRAAQPKSEQSSRGGSDHQGRFVPSVDAQIHSMPATEGRLEPGLRIQVQADPMMPAPSRAREPVVSVAPNADAPNVDAPNDDIKEPHLGSVPGQANEDASQQIPVFSVLGESRVRGDDPSAFGRTVPEFLEEDESQSGWSWPVWVIGSLLLGVALIIQLLVFFRNDIASTAPNIRPMLLQLCQPLGCEVGYVRSIDRIFIVGSALQQAADTQTGPQRQYVLRLTLQNRASFAQPWPALLLSLTDASGTVVIKKVLQSQEFLPATLSEGPFAAQTEVGVDIQLQVDGLAISGYEIQKFFP